VVFQQVLTWALYALVLALVQPSAVDFGSYRSWALVSIGMSLVMSTLSAVLAGVMYERLREAKEGMRPAELDKVFE
jgi:hypothetical protein